MRLRRSFSFVLLALLPLACGGMTPDASAVLGSAREALSGARGVAGDRIADVEVGRRDFTEIMAREIVADKLNSPGGVVVDTSVSPGRAYVWDSGNSRILGLDLGQCYGAASGTRCTPSLIFGQPSGSDHGACNLDSSAQQYPARPAASASTLCGVRETTHTVLEDKSFANMFVDASSNLWVPDALNNRVLKYNTPFSTDTVADAVFGQPNFAANGCNGAADWTSTPAPSASTLCFWNPIDEASGSGVRLDSSGNLWVADGGNHRVLRFKKGTSGIATTADIVLGQSSFTTRATGSAMNQLFSPSAIAFDSSGKLYVADGGNHRVVVFTKNASGNFVSGQSASGTIGTFDSAQYGPTTVEIDPSGRGLWTTRFVNYQSVADLWSFSGGATSVPSINIPWNSGGSIAFDAQQRMLLTDYVYGQDLLRYTAQADGSYVNDRSFFTPPSLYNLTTARRFEAPAWTGVGVADKVSSPRQLIASDGRLMFWNNPTALTLGQAPDGCVGGDCLDVPTPFNGELGYEQVKVDASDRVWVTKMNDVRVFQAPLSATSSPIKTLTSVPVLGGGTITFSGSDEAQVHGLAPTPDGQYLWVSQPRSSRVLRIRGPLGASPVVDVILGQTSSSGASCNRDGGAALSTLCQPGALSLDRNGNLFVSDHFIEFDGNKRLLMFAASTFPATPSSVLYAPAATKEFPQSNNFGHDMATFEPAFDSSNRMVVGFNPYTGMRFVQYYDNPTALVGGQASDPSYSVPTGQLEDFYGWPVAITFDSSNNLYVYDANRGRVNVYKTPFGTSSTCNPTISAYYQGKCNSTVNYQGKLYKCISQAAGVNGEPTGCGSAGVYCSNIPPNDPTWGASAWQLVQSCP
jgi:sugar lactone lactonase YvrE